MRHSIAVFVLGCVSIAASAAVVDQDATIQGNYANVVISPEAGCTIEEFVLKATGDNVSGPEGLMQEGFGVGNYYVPNRRLNEKLEVDDQATTRPKLEYTYDCDGPNIAGIHVTRTIEPMPDAASVKVTWRLDHRGKDEQWIAPWVRNDFAAGGSAQVTDRIDAPTLSGIRSIDRSTCFRASRNWVAVTDPATTETVYAVFSADQTFSYLVQRTRQGKPVTSIQTNFAPQVFAPGETWQTTYRINIVRGLSHIDFATDELAAQVDYKAGKLELRLSAPKALPTMIINATVVGPDGKSSVMPPKRFQLDPTRVIRCTYDWVAPGEGAYDLLAQVVVDGKPYMLGQDTGSPHGGIDTRFVVGHPDKVTMEGWTDAPYTLQRGPRKLKRTLAAPGDTAIWFEPSLKKIFHEDEVQAQGDIDPTERISLARNESESFQLVLRPPKGTDLEGVRLRVHDLVRKGGSEKIDASQIQVDRVAYVPVDVPSYFEGPTGDAPDPLPPLDKPFTARGGQCSPIWITVHAPAGTKPGVYNGLLELTASGLDPVELWIEATVYNFTLPVVPALKTDFGIWGEEAARRCRAMGYTGTDDELKQLYLDNALQHRVTLQQLTQFPAESADYGASLKDYAPRLKVMEEEGASTYAVPDSLLDFPDQLRQADEFVVSHKLQGKVFSQIADNPPQPAWPRVYDRAQAWHKAAPHIPLMITTFGLQPFLTDAADIWTVHSPMLDTSNNSVILKKVADGGEVWWYVNHAPPRPYANFFLDFAGIEHRVLFWQTWVLGFKGFYYWSINFMDPRQDPWKSQIDITPVNGDGFLVYPSKNGPVNSIRWEIIRDGIDDFDYLTLLSDGIRDLKKADGHEDVLKQAETARNLQEVVTSLVVFSRDPSVMEKKREQIAAAIEAIDNALGR